MQKWKTKSMSVQDQVEQLSNYSYRKFTGKIPKIDSVMQLILISLSVLAKVSIHNQVYEAILNALFS